MLALAAVVVAGCAREFDLDTGSENGRKSGENGCFKVSVGAASGHSPESSGRALTRTQYDPGAPNAEYLWSVGDKTGLWMVPVGSVAPVIDNLPMTAACTAPSRTTDFEGTISREDIEKVVPTTRYDYYSCYPRIEAAAFPSAPFEIPAEITLQPDRFPVEYGLMVADKMTTPEGGKPLTWLEDGRQHLGQKVDFRYRHVFAWLEIYLKVNLMSKPISRIVVKCEGGDMAGRASIDLRTGVITGFAGGSKSLTVNIEGGLKIEKAAGGVAWNRIWIPVNPALSGERFTFEFYVGVDGKDLLFESQTVEGKALVASSRHKVGFALPFHVDFSKSVSGSGASFTSFGHTITARNSVSVDGKNDQRSLKLKGDNKPEKRGAIKLPTLDGTIHPDWVTKSRKVKIKVDARGPSVAADLAHRLLYYAGTTATEYNLPDGSLNFELDKGTGTPFRIYEESTPTIQLGAGTHITFKANAKFIVLGYNHWIRQIWVYPQFDKE